MKGLKVMLPKSQGLRSPQLICTLNLHLLMGTVGLPICSVVKNPPATAGDIGDAGLIPG